MKILSATLFLAFGLAIGTAISILASAAHGERLVASPSLADPARVLDGDVIENAGDPRR